MLGDRLHHIPLTYPYAQLVQLRGSFGVDSVRLYGWYVYQFCKERKNVHVRWCRGKDSNLRHTEFPFKIAVCVKLDTNFLSVALPTELPLHICFNYPGN